MKWWLISPENNKKDKTTIGVKLFEFMCLMVDVVNVNVKITITNIIIKHTPNLMVLFTVEMAGIEEFSPFLKVP